MHVTVAHACTSATCQLALSPQTQLSAPPCILSRWQVHFAGMDNAGAMAQLQALHQIQGMGGMGGVQVSRAMLRCVVLNGSLLK